MREKILKELIRQKTEYLRGLEEELIGARKETSEAEGRRGDNPENPKAECRKKVFMLEDQIQEGQNCLNMLQNLLDASRDASGDCVALGSLVTLEENGGRSAVYIIVPRHGACSTIVEGVEDQEIICIAAKAPLAQAILNKKPGNVVDLRGNIYTIIDVQ